MKGLLAGWRDDDELGPIAVIVSEDATNAVCVSAEALRDATGDGAADFEIDDATDWVTVTTDGSVALLEPRRVTCPDIDLETARDLALARLGDSEPWSIAPDVFVAAAVVRHDGFRTVVSFPGAADSVLSGRVPRRRAAMLAHEEAVDLRAARLGLAAIPEAVLAHYPAIRTAYRDGAPGERASATRSVSYRSGMSRVGDLSASAASGVPTGVVISELNARAKAALLEANAGGVRFFVDSGAFAARRDGAAPVDFDAVCRAYRELADGAAHPELLSVVAPDRVGDRDGTLALLGIYRTDLLALVDRGVELLVPLQRHVPAAVGDPVYSLADTYRETVRILGTDRFRCALPARVSVFTETEILEFVRDAKPSRLHLLGVGSSAELPMRLRRLGSVSDGLDVSTDACQFRAGLGRGRPLQQIIDVSLTTASRDAVLHGAVPADATPMLGGTEPRAEALQTALFDGGHDAGEAPDSGFDITEYLHDLYNSPGFLDRDDAIELAARLTDDPRSREAIVLAALALVDLDDRTPEDVSRSLAGLASAADLDTREIDDDSGRTRAFGSPLGCLLDRMFPDDRVVDRVVYSMLVEEATQALRQRIRAHAVADGERNREFWEGWDVRVEHPFGVALGEPYRGPGGETERLADGSRLTWLERIAWAGRSFDESGDLSLIAGEEERSESFVVAYGRVARFDSLDQARTAFREFTSPNLASWLERAAHAPDKTPSGRGPVNDTAMGVAPVLTLSPHSPQSRIEDFGEVIEGARKHYAAAYRDLFAFASDVDIASAPLSKSWPEPNYQRLVDEGADPWVVGMMRSIRDEVPARPQHSWKLSTWARSVTRLRGLAGDLLETDGAREKFEVRLAERENRHLRTEIAGRAELYMHAGHSRSLKGVTLNEREFSVYNGERFERPRLLWVIEAGKLASSRAWPSRIAACAEKSEAIETFLTVHGKAIKPVRKTSSPFEIWKYKDRDGFFIGATLGRDQVELLRFDTVAAARLYNREHQAELVAMLERQRLIPSERRPANEPRTGPPRRTSDVTVDQFLSERFVRGCQFGNYVEGARRQTDLNNAYDALQDLADILGVTPASLSLGGQLGLAFGARGRGGNSGVAHYETQHVVINLTKTRGAGSLAHEWFHALDNAVARLAGARDSFGTEAPRLAGAGVGVETGEAFKKLVRAIHATGLPSRSHVLDKRRRKDYWSTGRELGARAFEAFVIARLAECGVTNDYLANISSESEWESGSRFSGHPAGTTYPYPTAKELLTLVPAFKDFVESIDWPGRMASTNRLDAAHFDKELVAPRSPLEQITPALPDAFGICRVSDEESGNPLWRVAADITDPGALDRAKALAGVVSHAGEVPSFDFRHPGNARAFVDATARVASHVDALPEAAPNVDSASGSVHARSGFSEMPSPVASAPEAAPSSPPLDSTPEAPTAHEPTGPLASGETPDDVRRVRLSLRVRDELLERSSNEASVPDRNRVDATAREVASWLSRQGSVVLAELEGLSANEVLSRAIVPAVAAQPRAPEREPARRAAVQLTLGL